MDSLFKRIKNSATIFLAEYILLFVINLIYFSCKKNFKDCTKEGILNKSLILIFWHGRLPFMAFIHKRWWKRVGKPPKIIISNHKDGQIITNIMKHFGVKTIRGSSSKGSTSVYREAFKSIDEGYQIGITPDGPRGPYHSIADGAIVLAQKKSLEIFLVNYEASSFWELKTWDKMIIPKPFSTINYEIHGPYDISSLTLEQSKELIKSELELIANEQLEELKGDLSVE